MKAAFVIAWFFCAGLMLAAGPAFAGRPVGCDLPEITGLRELQHFLSLRAVEVVKRAAVPDQDLAALVAPSASFSLGASDVGRPMGMGMDGARELARAMKADTYRFPGADYMDMPVVACSKHTVEVEFIDSQSKRSSRVKFAYDAGRVVGAVGWQRPFETGRL